MRTELVTVLALGARANSFFRGATGRMEVLAGHPAFSRYYDLMFLRQIGRGGELVAEASLPWFRRLKNEGVDRMRPILTGMRGDKNTDLPWGLLSDGDRGLELWAPNVGRRFEGHDDLQPLRLTMNSSRFDRWSLTPSVSLEQASAELRHALANAQQILEQGNLSVAANAVGKFLHLHENHVTEISGELASIATDIESESLPLFASGARCLTLLETTGWLHPDDSARHFAEPLAAATRQALETAA